MKGKFKILTFIIIFFSLFLITSCNINDIKDIIVSEKGINHVYNYTGSIKNKDDFKQDLSINDKTKNVVTVTFNLNIINENAITYKVYNDQVVKKVLPFPINEKLNFIGWYYDKNYNHLVDINKDIFNSSNKYVINNKIYIYARWYIDSQKITNSITTEYIKGNVKINTSFYEKGFFGYNKVLESQGSGVIFLKRGNSYYILTNNHNVVSKNDRNELLNKKNYIITDYQNNRYEATLIVNDPSYDLAILRFNSNNPNLKVLKFAKENPIQYQTVISLGQPKNQANAITYGYVEKYSVIKLKGEDKDISYVKFPVINHTAPLDHGSSGGTLLNNDLEIIGINFAGQEGTFNDQAESFAIPIEKVFDFFKANNLLK